MSSITAASTDDENTSETSAINSRVNLVRAQVQQAIVEYDNLPCGKTPE